MKTRITILLLVFSTTVPATQAPIINPLDHSISTEIVSLEKVPIVKVTFNGKTAYFVLDSGSDLSLLHSPEFNKYCQFTRRDKVRYHGFGEPGSSVEIAVNVVMEIAEKEINMNFVAQDLFKIRKTIFDEFRVNITGIIGSDLLKILGVRVDLERKAIVF